jgi:hypothetical protein
MQPNNIHEMVAAACIVSSIAVAACAYAQQSPALSDEAYTRQALAAGPEPRTHCERCSGRRPEPDGSMRTIRQGTNGFACLIMGTDRMCADKNSMEFIHANSGSCTCWAAIPARQGVRRNMQQQPKCNAQ